MLREKREETLQRIEKKWRLRLSAERGRRGGLLGI